MEKAALLGSRKEHSGSDEATRISHSSQIKRVSLVCQEECRWQHRETQARLVAKGFTQKDIDDTETFSPISTKDAFRIVMALVAHFNALDGC